MVNYIVQAAEFYFQRMRKDLVRADFITFAVLAQGYARAGNVEKVVGESRIVFFAPLSLSHFLSL